jgi:amiloride-sensitive sodium channel subunit alpha/amiloride-sensitive sodium channel subunit gamma
MTYLDYGVSTVSRTINESPALFPKVTFCNFNYLATKYAFDRIKSGADSVNNLSNEEKKQLGHSLNDIIIHCSFNGKACDLTDFVWSFDELYGNCYTFNSGFNSNGTQIPLYKSNLAGFAFGLQLVFYVNIYEKLLGYGMGAIVRIGNSSYMTDYLLGGIFLLPGLSTQISVEREFKSILPRPYSNCEIDSNSPKSRDDSDLYNLIGQSPYGYSQQFCFSQCMQKQFISKFNCSLPQVKSLYNSSSCVL